MTEYGIDMTYPPTPEQAQQMVNLGWRNCGVYIGGPRAAAHNAWQNGPVQELATIFDGFFPFTVIRNKPWDDANAIAQDAEQDAEQAAADMGACGFNSDEIIILDLESGTYQQFPGIVRQYLIAYKERSAEYNPNRKLYLYSDVQSCLALQDLFAGTLMANWLSTELNLNNPKAPNGLFDPSQPPASAGWQYGGGYIASVSVDLDSFVDGFPFAHYDA